MTKIYDAIIIGAGHNGLTAALYLARGGWKTLVLERNERIGGAIRSGEVTLPGFIHDLYSTNQNLFLGSPVYKELRADLERHGLRYRTSSSVYCNVFPDSTGLRVYQNADQTLQEFQRHDPQDALGWLRLYEHFAQFKQSLLPLYAMPLPSSKAALGILRAIRSVGVNELLDLGRIVLSSTRELADAYFVSPEAKALIAAWGMHLDFGPDVSGGGMFPFLEAFADMEVGMSIVEGGASRMVQALAGLLEEYGGEVQTHSPVQRVLLSGDRATGVELSSGEQFVARRAVIANVTPTILFEQLLSSYQLPEAAQRHVRQYSYGPGTMMIHLALKEQPRWAAGDDFAQFAYVHIAPYLDDLACTYADAITGTLPANPLLVVGQTTAVDPTRAPPGQHILWIQIRALPSTIRHDAAQEIAARTWEEAKEPFADRMIQKLATYAPGIQDRILARTVFSPEDLERQNPNLAGGDSVGGSHHLRQNFLWRPFPGWSTYRMPVEHLYMVGAATWPGAGTNATSGYLAAQLLLHPHELRNRVLAGSLLAGASGAGMTVAIQRLRALRTRK